MSKRYTNPIVTFSYVDTEDLSEWYSKKYNVEKHVAEDLILSWMGMFDNGNETSFMCKSDDEEWIHDFFKEFPEVNDYLLLYYMR